MGNVDSFHLVVFILCNYCPGNPGTPFGILGTIPCPVIKYHNIIDDFGNLLSTLKQLREGCVVQFLSNYTFCEYFKDLNDKYTKGNDDVLSLFLLQLLGTQIGLKSVGLWNKVLSSKTLLRYALKKKNDIIWEFFPNVGPPPPFGNPLSKKKF